jgi:hypothetical protein
MRHKEYQNKQVSQRNISQEDPTLDGVFAPPPRGGGGGAGAGEGGGWAKKAGEREKKLSLGVRSGR